MNCFAADTAAIFDGPLAVDAEWRPGAVAPGTLVRAILKQPDDGVSFGVSRAGVSTTVLLVPVDHVPTPAREDTFVVEDVTYKVNAAPRRDARRLWWVIEASA